MADVLKRDRIAAELEEVRRLDPDGVLRPEHGVAWARQHPESALHQEIEWDDTRAAERHRIDQVRNLIRVVVVQSAETGRNVRAYVSQPTDRVHGGGYRSTAEALARARQELVAEALKNLVRFRDRYSHLPELDSLFAEIDALVRRHTETSLKVAG